MAKVRFLSSLSCLILLLLPVSCGVNDGEVDTYNHLITLVSADFASGTSMPAQFTCDGADISPALTWSNLPVGTESFALICDDPDAPGGTFVHWIIFNIPASSTGLYENIPHQDRLQDGTLQGKNDFGKVGYGGPCPPSDKIHHYRFTLYALDSILNVSAGAKKSQLVDAMQGHVLDSAELVGLYSR